MDDTWKYGQNFYLYATKYNKLNYSSTDDSNFYYFSFSLYPEDDQPSGNINFSMIKGKSLQLKINQNFLNNYFDTKINLDSQNLELIVINRYYNLMNFSKGKGTSVFY